MLAAITLPRLLDRVGDRSIMIVAATLLGLALAGLTLITREMNGPQLWTFILMGWFVLGAAYSMIVTPTGRLLRRSANSEDRPTLFAAQFALSHICWLVAYPAAGWLGAQLSQAMAFAGMAALAICGSLLAAWLWPAHDSEVLPHRHDDLPADHPHLRDAHRDGASAHAFVIDDLHPRWPGRA